MSASHHTDRDECFVIMPISDPEGYPEGHFLRVYEDIFVPACTKAGFQPVRADQVREANLIHLDMLQRLLRAPMCLCDLSSRNPNVLFELGLRQAFDRPVVLVQERGTPRIFDIAPLRVVDYHQERLYNEVLEDQEIIRATLEATAAAVQNNNGVNSLVRILSLSKPAVLPEVQELDRDPLLQLIRAEINQLREDILALTTGAEKRLGERGDSEDYRVRMTGAPKDPIMQVSAFVYASFEAANAFATTLAAVLGDSNDVMSEVRTGAHGLFEVMLRFSPPVVRERLCTAIGRTARAEGIDLRSVTGL